MSYLLYASNEMFSSTQLIRKSKDIFDKLTYNEIDKAVILRDGKPNFILLDFDRYEKIMSDYKELQEIISNNIHKKQQITKQTENVTEETTENINEPIINAKKEDKVSDEELKKTLAEIESLNLAPKSKNEFLDTQIDTIADEQHSSAQIKEFWN